MFYNNVFVLPSRAKRSEDGMNMLSQNVTNQLRINNAKHPRRPKTPNYTIAKA
jgi:hypothetical protein